MTTDLTSLLRKARSRERHWSEQDFLDLSKYLSAAIPHAHSDWDEGAGEDWSRILAGYRVVAYVRRDAPLVIVLREFIDALGAWGDRVEVVATDDFSAREFSLDPVEGPELLPGIQLWTGDAKVAEERGLVYVGKFSMQELWWATAY